MYINSPPLSRGNHIVTLVARRVACGIYEIHFEAASATFTFFKDHVEHCLYMRVLNMKHFLSSESHTMRIY